MDKTASLTITVGSNPTFAERYFVDFRDTTHSATGRQLRTWCLDAPEVRDLVDELVAGAASAEIKLSLIDRSGEVL